MWSTKDGQLLHEMRRAAEGAEEAAAVVMMRRRMMVRQSLCSVGEGMVASGGEDGAVRVWSTKDGQLLHELDQVRVMCCSFVSGKASCSHYQDGAVATPLYSGCCVLCVSMCGPAYLSTSSTTQSASSWHCASLCRVCAENRSFRCYCAADCELLCHAGHRSAPAAGAQRGVLCREGPRLHED